MVHPSSKKLISSENPKAIIGWWVFSLLWCGTLGFMLYVLAVLSHSFAGSIVAGSFLLIGLVALCGTVLSTLEYFKFGTMRLTLEGTPPAVGGRLVAKLELSARAMMVNKITGELVCVRKTYTRVESTRVSVDSFGPNYSTDVKVTNAWAEKRGFPVLRGAYSGLVELRIDIPAGLPATDRLEDSTSEFGSVHHWELRVTADAPGIDLQRTFELQVLPAPAGVMPAVDVMATAAQTPAALPGAAMPRATPVIDADERGSKAGIGNLAGSLAGLAILGVFLYQWGFLGSLGQLEDRLRQAMGGAVARNQPIAGFDIQPETPQYVRIAARGLSAETHDGELRVRLEEIRLENLRGKSSVYSSVGAVVYRRGDWPSRSFGYVWHNDAAGTLTADAPVATLKDRVFRFPGVASRCDAGECEARLLVVVQLSPQASHREDTAAARLEVRPASR